MTKIETNGMQIVERITQKCKEMNIVKKNVLEALSLPDNCFSNWSARGTIPAADVCIRIADYLNVSVEWLVTGKEKGLSSEERNLLRQWSYLTPQQKETIQTLLDKWEENYTAAKKENA